MTQEHQTAPSTRHLSESRYAWNQVGVAFLCGGIFNGTIIYAYSLLMVLISVDIEASAFEQMWPKTAMMVGGALLAPLIGPLVDRHPIKHFLILGVVCFAAGLAVVSITRPAKKPLPNKPPLWPLLVSPAAAWWPPSLSMARKNSTSCRSSSSVM